MIDFKTRCGFGSIETLRLPKNVEVLEVPKISEVYESKESEESKDSEESKNPKKEITNTTNVVYQRFSSISEIPKEVFIPNIQRNIIKEHVESMRKHIQEYTKLGKEPIFGTLDFVLYDNAYYLVEELDITVCPYCNRNYVHNVIPNGKNMLRTCELDHFYPKSKYPLLALSFYNLIPSCKTCNQTFKKEKLISYNPYTSLKDFQFRLKIENSKFYYDKSGLKIDFSEAKQILGKNFTELCIEELYNQHKDIALELIQKSQTYNESYIDELFNKYEGTLFRSREDVLRLALGNFVETEDFEKRPLAKFTHDIAEEL
jgi:hypothetical protein